MVLVRKLETSNLKTLELDLNLLQSKSMSNLILILKESKREVDLLVPAKLKLVHRIVMVPINCMGCLPLPLFFLYE
jgi:hypothetical protein